MRLPNHREGIDAGLIYDMQLLAGEESTRGEYFSGTSQPDDQRPPAKGGTTSTKTVMPREHLQPMNPASMNQLLADACSSLTTPRHALVVAATIVPGLIASSALSSKSRAGRNAEWGLQVTGTATRAWQITQHNVVVPSVLPLKCAKCGDGGGRSLSSWLRVDGDRIPTRTAGSCGGVGRAEVDDLVTSPLAPSWLAVRSERSAVAPALSRNGLCAGELAPAMGSHHVCPDDHHADADDHAEHCPRAVHWADTLERRVDGPDRDDHSTCAEHERTRPEHLPAVAPLRDAVLLEELVQLGAPRQTRRVHVLALHPARHIVKPHGFR